LIGSNLLFGFRRGAAVLAALCIGLWSSGAGVAGTNEVVFLQLLEGQWAGQGRAATTQGEIAVLCDVQGELHSAARISLNANCRTPNQTGRIGMSLYFSDMTQQFHGELSSPLNYISGGLNGRLSRGDLFLRLSADDGSQGRLLLVAQGSNQVRLLVTTIVNGANITVFDLPLARTS
jgi:hypothetical protein